MRLDAPRQPCFRLVVAGSVQGGVAGEAGRRQEGGRPAAMATVVPFVAEGICNSGDRLVRGGHGAAILEAAERLETGRGLSLYHDMPSAAGLSLAAELATAQRQ